MNEILPQSRNMTNRNENKQETKRNITNQKLHQKLSAIMRLSTRKKQHNLNANKT